VRSIERRIASLTESVKERQEAITTLEGSVQVLLKLGRRRDRIPAVVAELNEHISIFKAENIRMKSEINECEHEIKFLADLKNV
jgi:uncharacterized small protein (DUF1192 family)